MMALKMVKGSHRSEIIVQFSCCGNFHPCYNHMRTALECHSGFESDIENISVRSGCFVEL